MKIKKIKSIKLLVLASFFLMNYSSFGSKLIPDNKISFTKNQGQLIDVSNKIRNDIEYYSKNGSMDLYISYNSILYVFKEVVHEKKQEGVASFDIDTNFIVNYLPLNMKLINSNPNPIITSSGASSNRYNYFYTHCPEGISDIHTYDTILIKDVYPNIDWVIYSNQMNNGFKHEFIVYPGGNPNDIKIEYEGAENLTSTENELIIKTKYGKISDKDLYCYQGGQKITSKYKLNEGASYGFELETYDLSKKIVIDPLLVWSTYYGGMGTEWVTSVTTDINGFIYAVGYVQSIPVPALDPGNGAYFDGTFGGGTGLYDMIITKFDANYNMIWATYYGGTDGDYAQSVYTDSNGNVFVTGWSFLSTMPVFDPGNGAYFQTGTAGGWDVAILKFDPNGVRLWATTFGLTGTDYGYAIKTDAFDNVYLLGRTKAGVPTLDPGGGAYFQPLMGGGVWDSFISKFTNTGVLLWSTNIGGTDSELASGLDINANGVINVCGMATGSNLPLLNPGGGAYFQNTFGGGSTDAYITSFSPTGSLLYATLLGGSGDEYTDNDNGITHKSNSLTDIVVSTSSTALFTQNSGGYFNAVPQFPGSINGYIFEFDIGFIPTWVSYFGGAVHPSSVATNNNDELFINGYTSGNLDTLNPGGGSYYSNVLQGASDNFLISFDAAYSQTWGTYYGGSGNASVSNICTDNTNGIYCVAQTNSIDYPLLNGGGYFLSTGVGSYSFNISKFITSCPTLNTIGLINSSATTFCAIDSNNMFSVTPYTGAVNYIWTTPLGATINGNSDTSSISLNFLNNSGIVCVHATNGCANSDTACVAITTLPPVSIALTLTDSVCVNSQTTIIANTGTGYSYYWSTGGLSNTETLIVSQDTIVNLIITNSTGCYNDTSFTIYASPLPTLTISTTLDSLCAVDSTQISVVGVGFFVWNTGATTSNIMVSPANSSWYSATITNLSGCVNSDSIFITVLPLPVANISGNSPICEGESILLSASGGSAYIWLPSNTTVSTLTYVPISNGEVISLVASNGSCSDTAQVVIIMNAIPQINISPDTTISAGEIVNLEATGGSTYSWYPPVDLSCVNCATPVASPVITTTYIVQGLANNGCSNLNSVTIFVDEIICGELFIPNIFTPNGDLDNDVIAIANPFCIETMTFMVYDRWGNKVFETTDPFQGWDGYYRGKLLESGTYVYVVSAVLTSGVETLNKGNVTLLK